MIAVVKQNMVYSVKNQNKTFINKICVCLKKGDFWYVDEMNYTKTKKCYVLTKDGDPNLVITATPERLELYFKLINEPNQLQKFIMRRNSKKNNSEPNQLQKFIMRRDSKKDNAER